MSLTARKIKENVVEKEERKSIVIVTTNKGEVLDWVTDSLNVEEDTLSMLSKSSALIAGICKYAGSLLNLHDMQSITIDFINGKMILLRDESIGYRVGIVIY